MHPARLRCVRAVLRRSVQAAVAAIIAATVAVAEPSAAAKPASVFYPDTGEGGGPSPNLIILF